MTNLSHSKNKTSPEAQTDKDFESIDLDFFVESMEAQNFVPRKEAEVKLQKDGKTNFLKKVESYYSHHQLVDALLVKGEIPLNPVESTVGIGFLDIVNYSYLSKWLSPKENQLILNGLYSAFAHVIKKNGGFLNKIEGDSLMFHFGGTIDPKIQDKSQHEVNSYIAKNLFYTCIEVQRACQLFNEASKLFLDQNSSDETKESIEEAFNIISNLRMNLAMASGVDAKFQIKIRIGASLGEVSIGNFGPRGKKQWDVIGEPVIEAKRMEMSAPVGGLRISDRVYRILEKDNITQLYYEDFKRRAFQSDGKFRDIRMNELFSFKEVILEKKNRARFRSYSIQVSSDLPEKVARTVISFLELGEEGADEILDILQYYRGNRLVVEAIEEEMARYGILVNKVELLKILSPRKYGRMNTNELSLCGKILSESYSLFKILSLLGAYQDRIDKDLKPAVSRYNSQGSDESYLERKKSELMSDFKSYEKKFRYKIYFDRVAFPLIFRSIKSDILCYQNRGDCCREEER
ncbi:MAG: adenylate/guanylate cyclase domain-containing protein [Spirochaetales bacterium]|nr:adenylate/guanylate cyclase domain-containing protein [Spirochaetales bacterium]